MDQDHIDHSGCSSSDRAIGGLSPIDQDAQEPYLDDLPISSIFNDQPPNRGGSFQIGDDGICAECRSLFEAIAKAISADLEIEDDSPFRSHYESSRAIQKSMQNGCRTCQLFIEAYGIQEFEARLQEQGEATEGLEPSFTPQIYISYDQPDPCFMNVRFHDDDDSFPMIVFAPSENQDSVIPPYDIIRPSTSSYLSNAKRWLDECIDRHKYCASVDGLFLPTRLLFLGKNRVRVVETAQISNMQLQYATLSHAWGKLDFLRLCKENVGRFQECVPESQLTKTFRDAIYITRKLGLEYLWIDSLCIIQDDEQDWIKESALMSNVYGGSTINIAAADSFDGNGGCFYDYSKPRNSRDAFRYRFKLAAAHDDRFWEIGSPYLYQRCTSWAHLASRAWALQERLLAPRTLHFSKTDILWECHEGNSCSLYPEGLPEIFSSSGPFRQGWMKAPVTSIWPQIVDLYSNTQLTVKSDKLVALSRIASAVQSQTKDIYLAGMWRKDLESQLLWHTLTPRPLPRPRPYRAPTWSWAALDRHVVFWHINTGDFHVYTHVHNVYTQPTEPNNPLGQISGGFLTLSCSILMRGEIASKENLNTEELPPFYANSRSSLHTVTFHDDKTFLAIDWDAEEDHSGLLYFLPIAERTGISKLSGLNRSAEGLVLRKSTGKLISVQYSRLGIFRILWGETQDIERIASIMNRQKQTTLDSDFSEILERNEKYPDELGLIEVV